MADSRTQFITAATACFADRGFYGTSIASIVEDLPYTKQALLHHFGSKEKLYAEILKGISERLITEFDISTDSESLGNEAIQKVFIGFFNYLMKSPEQSRLLMRELLDNRPRAEKAQQWYLKPFLEKLTALVIKNSSKTFANKKNALTAIYQVLGAISYFAISKTTLEHMFGEKSYAGMETNFKVELRELIGDRLCS